MPLTVVRAVRPTKYLGAMIRVYHEGLGSQELYRFESRGGFDVVMLGRPGGLSFRVTGTHEPDAGEAPTEDNLVAVYLSGAGWNEFGWWHLPNSECCNGEGQGVEAWKTCLLFWSSRTTR